MKNLTLKKDTEYRATVDSLSTGEFNEFILLAKGLTTHKIGDELCLGYKTVANYGTQIKSKFKVSTVAELAHIAMIQGMLNS
jgi:two-component system, NarL family, invasion response regulator UvrY